MDLLENFGIGVDIESNDRFVGLSRDKDRNFLEKVFTDEELDYCFGKDDPAPYLCARFAAKEAAIKALSSVGISEKPTYKKIGTVNDRYGVPSLKLYFKNKILSKVSLSHSSGSSIALVIIYKNDEHRRKN